VALTAASNGTADASYIAGGAALALFLPFLAYLYAMLREAEGEHGWLAPAALAAGVAGITIKLASGAPEIAANHLANGTVHNALQNIASVATVINMYPLALLFVIWTLAASVTLFIKAPSRAVHPTPSPAPAAP
jgi:hypothetical protein